MIVPMTLIEDRVDWMTATVDLGKLKSDEDVDRAATIADTILTKERQRGNDIKRARWMGFDGIQAGGAFVGRGGRGYLFRLSGNAAATHFGDVAQLATNVSRLDVAATFELDSEWVDMSRVHHDEALRYQREHNPRMRVTRIDGGKHGNSLTVGSRSSDAYARIYDKHAESGLPEYAWCWRYEVEFKRDLANQATAILTDSPGFAPSPAGMACEWLRKRRIGSGQLHQLTASPRHVGASSNLASRLDWFRHSVSRSVEKCIEAGYLAEVCEALKLPRDVCNYAKSRVAAPVVTEKGE